MTQGRTSEIRMESELWSTNGFPPTARTRKNDQPDARDTIRNITSGEVVQPQSRDLLRDKDGGFQQSRLGQSQRNQLLVEERKPTSRDMPSARDLLRGTNGSQLNRPSTRDPMRDAMDGGLNTWKHDQKQWTTRGYKHEATTDSEDDKAMETMQHKVGNTSNHRRPYILGDENGLPGAIHDPRVDLREQPCCLQNQTRVNMLRSIRDQTDQPEGAKLQPLSTPMTPTRRLTQGIKRNLWKLVLMLTTFSQIVKKSWTRPKLPVYVLGTDLVTSSYYIKARCAHLREPFLIDSGCNLSILSTRSFEQLPTHLQARRRPYRAVAIVADGRELDVRGSIELELEIGRVKTKQSFLIVDVEKEALLGMDFLQNNRCHIDFSAYLLRIGTEEVRVYDKNGCPLAIHVQTRYPTNIPAGQEQIVPGWCTHAPPAGKGMIEAHNKIAGLWVGATLHDTPTQDIPIKVLNTTNSTLMLPAGRIVGLYLPVEEVQRNLANLPRKEGHGVEFYQLETKADLTPLPTHLEERMDEWCGGLDADDTAKVRQLLSSYSDVFSANDMDVGRTSVIKHSIHLQEGATPIKQRPYRHAPQQEEEIEQQVQDLLEKGLIEEGNGEWSSPVVLVRKKSGQWRFCCDFRRINGITKADAYPLPRVDDSLDALGGNCLFSTLDLTSGYWQVELDDHAKEISAFCTRSGLWNWNVMPFGLTCAPSTFERLMETVLRGLNWKTLLIYLDDVLVFSSDVTSHLNRLQDVFERMRKAGLKLKPNKCHLFQPEVEYLGHLINAEGIHTDPKKIQAVVDWPEPRHKTDVRSLLGTCGYYRKFIRGYSELAGPLTRLLRNDVLFDWTPACQQSFEHLKQSLTEAPILVYPDFSKTFIIDTDASNVGTGAVLSQVRDGKECVVAYYSKMLSKEEKGYCTTRKELLAIVKAVKHFKNYLYGRPSLIRTDHAPLVWLVKNTVSQNQVGRWINKINEFKYTLEHRRGLKHANADGLSRQQCEECCKQCIKHFPAVKPTEGDTKLSMEVFSLITLTSLALQQADDPDLRPVIKALQTHHTLSADQLKRESWETKQLMEMIEHLSINEEGVLVARIPVNNRRTTVAVCPRTLRKELITEAHAQAHLGIHKTTAKVRLHWHWPGLTADVRRHVDTCTTCQQCKTVRGKTAGQKQHLYVGRPWQQVAVDLVGPFQETERGNSWILVLTDHFTRWTDAIAIPDATASTVATTLDERVFAYFGVPEVIHTDGGSQFCSALFKACCELWGAIKTQTVPYSPTGNGVVEAGNKPLGTSLRTLLLEREHQQWDLLLPHIMRSIRSTPHTLTGETANYMMMGRQTRLPSSLTCPELLRDELSPAEYVIDLQQRLHDVGCHLRQQQDQQIVKEASEEPPLYVPGDRVWLKSFYKKKGLSAKLLPRYVGPYVIKESLAHHVYRMERDGKLSVQHEGRIRLHVGTADDGHLPQESSSPDNTGGPALSPPDEPTERLASIFEQRENWKTQPPRRRVNSERMDQLRQTVTSGGHPDNEESPISRSSVTVKKEPTTPSDPMPHTPPAVPAAALRRSRREKRPPDYLQGYHRA